MNCPGHMLLFGSRLRSYRDLPIRYAEARRCTGTSSPARCTACSASATSPRTTRTSSAPRSRSRPRSTRCIEFAEDLYALFGVDAARRAVDAARRTARHRRGVGPRRGRSSQAALERHGIEYVIGEGEGTFYGPKIDLHMTRRARPLLADGDDPGRRADAAAVRPHVHGRRQHRAHAVRHPPRAARLARALHRHPHRALRAARSRSGSRRCRCG